MKVSIREFTRNPYKYLKDLSEELVITKNDKPVYTIIVATSSRIVATLPPKKHNTPRIVATLPKIVATSVKPIIQPKYNAYSCGCKKTDARLCAKHHRS